MSLLTDIKSDLYAINYLEDHPTLLSLMPFLLDDLEDDLWGSGITSVTLTSLNLSYAVVYGTIANDTLNVIAMNPPNMFNPSSPFPPDINFNNFNLAWLNNYILVGGPGNDRLTGGLGDDILLGGRGNDILEGGFGGSNTLWGDGGNDKLYGSVADAGTFAVDLSQPPFNGPPYNGFLPFIEASAPQYLFGGTGSDLLVGGSGSSSASLSNGMTVINASGGLKYFDGGDGNDVIYGSGGLAEINFTNMEIGASSLTEAQHIIKGGAGDDYIIACVKSTKITFTNSMLDSPLIINSQDNNVSGGDGNDTLVGGFGNREFTITGGSGQQIDTCANARLDGGNGNDLLIGDNIGYSVTITGTTLASFETHCGDSTLIGGRGNDVLIGDIQWNGYVINDSGAPVMAPLHLDKTEYGGNNILFGGQGDDTLTGGNAHGPAANFLGANKFVYDGCINNGDDIITDFNVALDTLVGQNGATFTSGGIQGGNLVINVNDAGWSSTITLTNIHTDIFSSIMQSNVVIV